VEEDVGYGVVVAIGPSSDTQTSLPIWGFL